METAIQIAPHRYVTIKLASTVIGRTESAIRHLIERGEWLEGHEWFYSPDNRITIDLDGYARWLKRERKLNPGRH